eukprot:TRINITY_DN2777_c0_g1_i2.p1 TRINITY_DN2777_c0_g1~~TRINITY_DN2777_c0_g1_i2.p1  ORF type:complete len:194 (+),score=32.61 TRINITY_DN2777_c0_g1_i2:233-814(+)
MISCRIRIPPQPEISCTVCKKVDGCSLCAGCGIRAYCGKEHQREHWPKHRSECKEFRESKRQGNLIQSLTSSPSTEELGLLKNLWASHKKKQSKNSNEDTLCGEEASAFIRDLCSQLVESQLSTEHLQGIFLEEYGETADLPPPEFFANQRSQILKDLEQDMWRAIDSDRTGTVHLQQLEDFVCKYFVRSDDL